MPAFIGHSAIGLTIAFVLTKDEKLAEIFSKKRVAMIAGLANLPDIDCVIGFLFKHDWLYYHRGPTHSILFAVLATIFLYCLMNWKIIPRIPSWLCFLAIFSHDVADYYLSSGNVDFFYPFITYYSPGRPTWDNTVVYFYDRTLRDLKILLCCMVIVFLYDIFFKKRIIRQLIQGVYH